MTLAVLVRVIAIVLSWLGYATAIGGLSISIGENLRLRQCKHGVFLFSTQDTYIGKSLDTYGEWSEGEVHVFSQIIRKGWRVFDVGANLGAFTVPFSKMVGPQGLVVAFEPQRIVYQLLVANVALNEITNTVVHNMAVGKETGVLPVPKINYTVPANFGALSLLDKSLLAGAEKDQVPLTTLDTLARSLQRCPHFVKVDVEGMERDVLEGSVEVLGFCSPILYIENNCIMDSEFLIQHLAKFNYTMHWDIKSYSNPGRSG